VKASALVHAPARRLRGAGFARRRAGVAVLAIMSLVSAGCGARVAPYLGASAAAPGSSSNGSGSGPALGSTGSTGSSGKRSTSGAAGTSSRTVVVGATQGHTVGGASGRPGSGGGSSTGGGGGATGGGSTGQNPGQGVVASGFNFSPQAEASYCTGTQGNTASAPGVTPTSITVGNVSGLSGAVSDSFAPGSQAVVALFNSINRFGGICGRQLKVNIQDDQQSSSTNASDVQFLTPQVLAFVGSLSDADNGGVPAMVAAGVPDLGPAINTNRSNSPVYWSATGGSVTVRNGRALLYNTALNGAKQYGGLPKNIAVLSYSISISAQAGQEFAALYQKFGVPVCYTNYNISPAPGATMGSVVSAMQQHGCDGVFTTMDVVGNAQMLDDMQADNYHPSNISTTYEGYTPQQISLAGQSAAQGLQVGLSSIPLEETSNPGIALYTQEMATYQPGQPTTEFGLESWADAQLFVYALIKAGRNPTRASLVSAFQGVTNFTMEGAFGPYTPNSRTGPLCNVNVMVRGSGFVRQSPPTGLYCKGQLVDVGAAS
jgi:ABC-type branched-subunit amino acid transport system substrate-binding protein